MPLLSTKIFGAQLWLNLPASSKMTAPSYRDIRKKDIPVIHQNGTTIRIISGAYLDTVGGFIGNYVNATYLDIEISP
jgi:redox-sensitive bicupin YhaK (pirin superfamily)